MLNPWVIGGDCLREVGARLRGVLKSQWLAAPEGIWVGDLPSNGCIGRYVRRAKMVG